MRPRSKAAFEETNSSDGTELGIVARENATENAAAFFPPCPMDFKYFDSVVRSDDEAKYMAKWRRTDKKRSMEDTNAMQGVPAFSATEAKEPTPPPPSPAHLSDHHEDIMAVTLTNDDVRCQVRIRTSIQCSPLIWSAFCPKKIDLKSGLTMQLQLESIFLCF